MKTILQRIVFFIEKYILQKQFVYRHDYYDGSEQNNEIYETNVVEYEFINQGNSVCVINNMELQPSISGIPPSSIKLDIRNNEKDVTVYRYNFLSVQGQNVQVCEGGFCVDWFTCCVQGVDCKYEVVFSIGGVPITNPFTISCLNSTAEIQNLLTANLLPFFVGNAVVTSFPPVPPKCSGKACISTFVPCATDECEYFIFLGNVNCLYVNQFTINCSMTAAQIQALLDANILIGVPANYIVTLDLIDGLCIEIVDIDTSIANCGCDVKISIEKVVPNPLCPDHQAVDIILSCDTLLCFNFTNVQLPLGNPANLEGIFTLQNLPADNCPRSFAGASQMLCAVQPQEVGVNKLLVKSKMFATVRTSNP